MLLLKFLQSEFWPGYSYIYYNRRMISSVEELIVMAIAVPYRTIVDNIQNNE